MRPSEVRPLLHSCPVISHASLPLLLSSFVLLPIESGVAIPAANEKLPLERSEHRLADRSASIPQSAQTPKTQDTHQPEEDLSLPPAEPPLDIQVVPDPIFLRRPEVAPTREIDPFSTTLPLNGEPVSHLTEWQALTGIDFGEGRSTNFMGNGTVKLHSQLLYSLTRTNLLTTDYTSSYLQIKSVPSERQVTITRRDPQTMAGMEIQMSLVANCLSSTTDISSVCTYTPGLVTDRDSIDPQFQIPTRINQTANVQDVVSPDSLLWMQLPGFQNGANGQAIGLDLYFPNTGTTPGNQTGDRPWVTRKETFEYELAPFLSTVRQVVKLNDREAVIGRTIHGYGVIGGDRNWGINSALQVGTSLLPDAIPNLEGSQQLVNTAVNKNLFLAANNTRLPENTLTLYHAGWGRAIVPPTGLKSLNDIPSGSFNGIWIGLSPVIERDISRQTRYEVTSEPRYRVRSGSEGGIGTNVSFLSRVNAEQYSTNGLEDFYAQVYLGFFDRDVNLVNESRQVERTHYYPHVSLTGNITSTTSIFRYYTGLITGPTWKPYLGVDYTYTGRGGLMYDLSAIGYLNPDREYYSTLKSNLTQRFQLGKSASLSIFSGLNWAIDQQARDNQTLYANQASFVRVGSQFKFGPVSLGVTQVFGNLLPNSMENSLVANATFQIGPQIQLSGHYTLIDQNSTRSPLGIRLQARLGKFYNSPTLTLAWSQEEYDYGRDDRNRSLGVIQDSLAIIFRLGSPVNPFSGSKLQQVRQQVDKELNDLQQTQSRPELQPQ